MTELLITRGLPGSGKTTFARAWVAEDRGYRARVNRDDIRSMLDEGEFVKGVTEPRVLVVRDAAILGLLRKGVSVVNDDTNLPQRVARDLARLARQAGAEFRVHDMTDVPLIDCLARDVERTSKPPVGEKVIRDMSRRFLDGREYPLPLPAEDDTHEPGAPYTSKPGAPKAVIVDIDGTVALMGARSPFDETRVHEDAPNPKVIAVAQAMRAAGHRLVFVSGRTAGCWAATSAWLAEHVGRPIDGLYMRAAGDTRKDSIVKRELFDQHIRNEYDVTCVLDDRDQVVQMWRSLGLTVLQVAEGKF